MHRCKLLDATGQKEEKEKRTKPEEISSLRGLQAG